MRRDELARRWDIEITESFETESSVIAYGHRHGMPVVLKVVKQPGDEWRGGEVTAAFGGRGMARVLEYVDGAALFSRIVPGTLLVDLSANGRDDEATQIIADVMAAMAPAAAPSWCPTVKDWGRGFDWYLARGTTEIPVAVVRRASEMYDDLCNTQGEVRLLHGDLQHYNVLADRERGWVAIDPKGVVGELEYEVGASLRNPGDWPDLFASAATIAKRLDVFSRHLGLNRDRMLRWAFSQAVLSAIWHVEDGYTVHENNASLRLVRAIDALL